MSAAEAETRAFVGPWLDGRRRVLEVGCGEGALATWLAARGHAVTAVDRRDPGPLPGVRFVAGDFFDFSSEDGFDAVVLGASLHHLWPIEKAVAHLAELVVPGGLLVADDFDVAAPDAATAAWWRERGHGGHGHGRHGDDGEAADPLESWRAHHRHDGEPPLHDGAAMLAALEPGGFSLRAFSRGPYLYRYHDDDDAMLEEERRGILEGRLVAVGLRFVAERR